MRTFFPLIALGLALAGCEVENPSTEPTGPMGTMELPLTATGVSGANYRLAPGRFRITAPGYNKTFDAAELDILRVGLAPGEYNILLLGGWVLNVDNGEGFAPVEAVIQSPNPQTFMVVEGTITDIVYRFGVGPDAIAFGRGQARVTIDVDDCIGVESPACTPEVCGNGLDDDGDGFTDCDDFDCDAEPACNVPPVGTTGNDGVAAGADWEVCRADLETAWVSGGTGGGTYDTTVACQALGYDGADLHGGNCNTVCGYCGTPGLETYDNAGVGFPNAYRNTVHWRCANGFIPPAVGTTGNVGVAAGANWQVCRADAASAWMSAGANGGTYDTTAICNSLGYAAVGQFGGNCNLVCGYCGTPGLEQYDGAGAGFPAAFRNTVTWSCVNP